MSGDQLTVISNTYIYTKLEDINIPTLNIPYMTDS